MQTIVLRLIVSPLRCIDESEDVVEDVVTAGFRKKLEHLCIAHSLLFFVDLRDMSDGPFLEATI